MIEHMGLVIFSTNSETLIFLVAYITLLCGIFILSGLFTRILSLVQIPIIFTAIFFGNSKSIGESSFESGISVIVLILLILFAIKGSGIFSADEYFRTYYKVGCQDRNTFKLYKRI